MQEIYRMWQICRLLRKNRSVWAMKVFDGWDLSSQLNSLSDDPKAIRFIKAVTSHQEPRVKRDILCCTYVDTRSTIAHRKDISLSDERFICAVLEVQSIIDSCIDEKNGFLQKDSADTRLIYLSAKGKSFASIDGLLKEEITNGLGVLWSVIVTGGSVVAVVKWGLIWNYVIGLFPFV